MKVLIVDDEPLARARLKRLLSHQHFIEAITEAENGLQALTIARQAPQDLIFLDIEMPGDDGLTVAAQLQQLQPPPAVIFVTAHPQHALAALKIVPQGYLLKPVSLDELNLCLQKLTLTTRAQLEFIRLKQARLSFKVGLEQRSVLLDDVCYLQAEDKYVRIVYQGGEALTETSLVKFEQLYPAQLLRIHRNTLVLKHRIAALSHSQQGGYLLKLTGTETQLPVSRRAMSQLKEYLQN